MRNMYGRSRGCALVKFKTEEEAEYFIQEMNGQDLDGRILECRHDKGPTKRENDELRNASSNPGQQAFIQKSYGDTYSSGSAFGPNTSNLLSQVVFHVGNLGPRTTDYVLYQLFSAYGKVTSVNVNSSGDPWGKKIG